MTPMRAIVRGHLTINGPVLAIMVGTVLMARFLMGPDLGTLIGLVVAFFAGWLWWSFAVPRWRDWVIDRGLRPEDVQRLAVQAGLLWPPGSFFERTEFRRRNGQRGWGETA